MAHRNSLSNDEPHHLYEIRDKVDDDVFKYGISSDPIEDDGLSKRIRVQLDLLNLVDRWAKKDTFQFEPDQPIVVKEIQHPLLQAR